MLKCVYIPRRFLQLLSPKAGANQRGSQHFDVSRRDVSPSETVLSAHPLHDAADLCRDRSVALLPHLRRRIRHGRFARWCASHPQRWVLHGSVCAHGYSIEVSAETLACYLGCLLDYQVMEFFFSLSMLLKESLVILCLAFSFVSISRPACVFDNADVTLINFSSNPK